MSIAAEVALLAPSAPLEFYVVDMTALGGGITRFHAGKNALEADVVWQGATYNALAIEAEGFEYDGSGQLPRPKLRLANLSGMITGFLLDYDELRGARVTRKRTLARYLDAVNFPGGVNPDADPDEQFPDEVFYIDRRSSDDGNVVEFELGSSYDVLNVQLPGRQIIDNLCAWVYASGEGCAWVPSVGHYYDLADAATDAAGDACSHKLSGCEVRFGAANPLDFGGFPAAQLLR